MNGVNSAFIDLEKRVRTQGLLEPTPAFYIGRVAAALAMMVISVVILTTAKGLWIQIANAAFLAFAFGQFTLFVHDVGHGQVTGSRWHVLMSVWFSMMLGLSFDWWVYKHNRHHAFPNQPGYDPDLDIPVLAFSEDQAHMKKGWYRLIARYQHILFPLLLLGETWNLRCASIAYLVRRRTVRAVTDLFLIAVHLCLYAALLIFFLPPWHALAFALVHWGLLGVYLGFIFAPNHKGMPIVEHASIPGFLEQQVMTARNVRGGRLVDVLYGGLNYQIEHHLFPAMPRSRLKDAAPIVEAFCRERNISYTAVDVRESFREIFGYLSRVGKTVPTD